MSDLNKINLILTNSRTQTETQRRRRVALICVRISVGEVVKLSIKLILLYQINIAVLVL